MRTLIIIALGLVITGLALRFTPSTRWILAGAIFTIVWLALVLWNLRTGLAHGYTLKEEAPIHLLLFFVPMGAYWGYVAYALLQKN